MRAFAAFCLSACAAFTLSSALAWEMGDPIVTYWAGPGFPHHPEKLTERAARQLKEGGFNAAWVYTREELDVCRKYGIRGILNLRFHVMKELTGNRKQELADKIRSLKDHPALYMYHHADEPNAPKFGPIAEAHEWIRSVDPTHPTWSNLLAIYSWNKQLGIDEDVKDGYREHVRRYCDIYRPQFLSFGHYQFNVGYDMQKWFSNLEIIRQSAVDRNVPYIAGVQACTWKPGKLVSPDAPRIPGPAEMRYLVYTSLAYGAQGIYYYVYSFPGHFGAIAELDGTTGDKYEELKTLNPAFVAIAKELRPLRFAGGFAQGELPPSVTPYCPQAILRLEPEFPSVKPTGKQYVDTTLVTRFEAPGKPTHLMVVNLDYCKDRTLAVTAPNALERFSVSDGKWLPLAEAGVRFDLALKGGEGVLLRLKD